MRLPHQFKSSLPRVWETDDEPQRWCDLLSWRREVTMTGGNSYRQQSETTANSTMCLPRWQNHFLPLLLKVLVSLLRSSHSLGTFGRMGGWKGTIPRRKPIFASLDFSFAKWKILPCDVILSKYHSHRRHAQWNPWRFKDGSTLLFYSFN